MLFVQRQQLVEEPVDGFRDVMDWVDSAVRHFVRKNEFHLAFHRFEHRNRVLHSDELVFLPVDYQSWRVYRADLVCVVIAFFDYHVAYASEDAVVIIQKPLEM